MSEPTGAPASKGASFLRKKVAGVPVMYLAGGTVVLLALYAYHSKSTKAVNAAAAAAATDPNAADPNTLNGGSPTANLGTNVIDPMTGQLLPVLPQGTVIVSQPNPANTAGTNSAITDNDQWLNAGVTYLTTKGVSAGTAQVALQAYLTGAQLSFQQGQYRDEVIGQIGLPPTVIQAGGTDPAPPPPANPAAPVPPPAPVIPAPPPVVLKPPPVVPPTKINTPVKVPPKPLPVPRPVPVAPKPTHPYAGMLSVGSRGANVALVQHVVGAPADGIYGPVTKAHVVAWQRAHGLSADGIVGPLTWRAMFG
jgi:peptidoglycan hydrolase-like protein with peptidoglycan-binding domain